MEQEHCRHLRKIFGCFVAGNGFGHSADECVQAEKDIDILLQCKTA